jgi:hypothetical protein
MGKRWEEFKYVDCTNIFTNIFANGLELERKKDII